MITSRSIPVIFLCVQLFWLCSCGGIPGRQLEDRCYVYIESEDICVQHGGEVVRDWSDSHPWDDERVRYFEVYIAGSGAAWEQASK